MPNNAGLRLTFNYNMVFDSDFILSRQLRAVQKTGLKFTQCKCGAQVRHATIFKTLGAPAALCSIESAPRLYKV